MTRRSARSLEAPMGLGTENLHTWMLRTRYFQRTHFGKEEGDVGLDNDIAEFTIRTP
jgi:hypothetical protein